MSRVALVIMYSGSEPSTYIKDKLAQTLLTSGVSSGESDINIYYFDEKEVAEGLIRHLSDNNVINEHFRKSEYTIEEDAVIYVGTLCSRSIMSGDFSYDLMRKCLEVFKNKRDDDRLLKAINIIAKDYSLSRVSDEIQSKYHFGLEQYKIVCRIYDVCQRLKGELSPTLTTKMLFRIHVRKSINPHMETFQTRNIIISSINIKTFIKNGKRREKSSD